MTGDARTGSGADSARHEVLETGTTRLRSRIEGRVGWLVFDQPEKRNALSIDMQRAVPPLLDRFAQDEAVHVVVLRGAGEEAFASGADISEFEEQRSSAGARAEFDRVWRATRRAFARFEKPVVAMIHGVCFGGGLATALQADLRLASEDARFAIPAARLGLGYGFEGVERLVRQVGPSAASEILYTARAFDAREALRMRLVDRVVGRNELERVTTELCQRMAENAPLTLRAAKAAIRASLEAPDARDLEGVATRVRECFESDDYREGRRAFREKRRPLFRGR